jgi:hypothetical protein
MTVYPSPVKTWFSQSQSSAASGWLLLAILSQPAVFALWLAWSPGGDDALMKFDDGILAFGASLAAVATWAAARRYEGSTAARAWTLVCIGMVLIAFGEIAWGVQEAVLGTDVESPSIADIGYLGFYVPVFFGLLLMPQAPLSGMRRIRLTLDIAIAIAAIALISGNFLISSVISDTDGLTTGNVIYVAYPVLDLVLVLGAIVLAVRGGRTMSTLSIVLLAGGFASIAFSDSFFTYLSDVGKYDSGNWIDGGWVIGYALIAVAGLIAAGRPLNLDTFEERAAHHLPVLQTIGLHLPLAACAGLLFVDADGWHVHVNAAFLAGFVALVVLALLRQVLLLVDYEKMLRQSDEFATELRKEVQTRRMQSLAGSQWHNPHPAPAAEPGARMEGFQQ